MTKTGNNFFIRFYHNASRDIRVLLAMFYLFAVSIGMLFMYFRYAVFGIHIFNHADVFDFLIAPFSDIRIIVFAVFALVLPYLISWLDTIWKRKYPRSYHIAHLGLPRFAWFKYLRTGILVLAFIFLLVLAAIAYGNVTKDWVMRQPPVEVRFFDDEIKEGIMLGQTKYVIFLQVDGQNTVIPKTSLVKEIRKNDP